MEPSPHEEYTQLRPLLESFEEHGFRRLSELLATENLELSVPLHTRIKDLSSVLEKIQRKGLSNLLELSDLVGFRLVVTYRRHLEHACQIVETAFRIDGREEVENRLGPGEFGYASIHFTVRAADDWRDKSGGRLPTKLRAEVQVRTLAQHLWAHTSHDLQYKNETLIPSEMRRSMNRAAALLELVDLEFERVLQEREDYGRASARLDGTSGQLDETAMEAALSTLWPTVPRLPEEDYQFLLHTLQKHGISDLGRLAEIIRLRRVRVLDYSRRYVERFLRDIDRHGLTDGRLTVERPGVVKTSSQISPEMVAALREGHFFGHVALTCIALDLEFGTGEMATLD